MKKILLGVAVTAMLAGTSYADSGAYIGLGLGKAYANAENKMSGNGLDAGQESTQIGFGERKLKDKSGSINGKIFGGYEFDLSSVSLLAEVGIAFGNSKAEYTKNLELSNAVDDADFGVPPVITSTKLKRKNTFSLGLGVKKNLVDSFSVQAGLDLLYSRFEVKSTGTGTFDEDYTDVSKKKSKFGLGPWAGVSWDLGMVQTGIRYQYSRYQTLKMSGDFVKNEDGDSNFGVSNKIKPEYHTVMFTVSKKF